MKKLAIALTTTIAIQATSIAQIDRSIQPKPGAPTSINIKDSEVFTLENGITVIVSENHKIPKVSVQLILGSSSIPEGKKTGVSSIAGELLMSGTTNRTKDQLDREIDYIGAQLTTSSEYIGLDCLKKHLNKGLDLMTDVLYHPSFTEAEFDRIKKRKESDILSAKTEPNSMASNASSRANFPNNHPFGEIETDETIKNITLEDVKMFHQIVFTPKGSYLVFVGDITKEEAIKIANEQFKSWKGGEKIELNNGDGYFSDARRVLFVNKPNAVQSTINVTFPMKIKLGDKNQLALSVLNNIIGGGSFGTRLFQNLREKHAYTYGCYSKAKITQEGSYFVASGSFRNEVTDSAITEILNELTNITNEYVTDEELENVKASMAGNFSRSLEQPSTLAEFAFRTIRYNLPNNYYKDYLKSLNAVTKEELLAIAKQYLKVENCNIVVVGNESILDKIKKFDADGVIEKLDALGQTFTERKTATITQNQLFENYLQKITSTSTIKDASKKLKKLTTLSQIVEMTSPQIPVSVLFTSIKKSTFSVFETFEIQGKIQHKSVFNGTTGFEESNGQEKKILTASQIEDKFKIGGIIPEINLLNNSSNITLLGIESINGKDAFVVKYKSNESENYYYYDTQTYLKIKATKIEAEGEQSIIYSDYKEVSGILFPQTISFSMGGLNLEGKLKSIEVNSKIEDSKFN